MKNIVLNNAMIEFSSSQITTLFKPSNNPKHDDKEYMDRMMKTPVTNHFGLQQYPEDAANATTPINPIKTMYNHKNIVTNLFLVTENFLKFMNRLNQIWEADNFPRTLSHVEYTVDANGAPILDTVNNPPYSLDANGVTAGKATLDLISLFSGPAGNKSEPIAKWEEFARNGQYQKSIPGTISLMIPELLLRHLYSIDPDKRKVAFDVCKQFYGMDASLCDTAEKELIPAEDFDSDLLDITIADGDITIKYPQPFKLQRKFVNSIDNPTDEKLYWYFPLISGNTLNNLHTGMVSSMPISTNPNVTDINSFIGVSQANIPKGSATTISDLVEYPDNASLCSTLWDVQKDKAVVQGGYTVLEISEPGQGGDLIYDHTNEIDYAASWTMVIKGTSVFS